MGWVYVKYPCMIMLLACPAVAQAWHYIIGEDRGRLIYPQPHIEHYLSLSSSHQSPAGCYNMSRLMTQVRYSPQQPIHGTPPRHPNWDVGGCPMNGPMKVDGTVEPSPDLVLPVSSLPSIPLHLVKAIKQDKYVELPDLLPEALREAQFNKTCKTKEEARNKNNISITTLYTGWQPFPHTRQWLFT